MLPAFKSGVCFQVAPERISRAIALSYRQHSSRFQTKLQTTRTFHSLGQSCMNKLGVLRHIR